METIKSGLEKRVVNKKIEKVWIEKSFAKKVSPDAKKFIKKIQGEKFKVVWRRAKLLIFDISNDLYLLIHLKMTGQLVYRPKSGQLVFGGHPIGKLKELPSKHTRALFTFKDKSTLYFNDVRKFGFLKLVDDAGLAAEIEKYGLEPLDKEFTFKHFSYLLDLRPGMKVKQFLLDQKLISGLGNIYADESLFASEINPQRRVHSLKSYEKESLFQEIKKILRKAIKLKGTSVSDYVNSEGGTGEFQNHLKVYGQAGNLCKKCKKAKIAKIKLGGRSSSYCPVCQK